MAAYCRVYGVVHFTSPAGWLPVHRDQLRAQRSVTSMGKLCLVWLLGLQNTDHAKSWTQWSAWPPEVADTGGGKIVFRHCGDTLCVVTVRTPSVKERAWVCTDLEDSHVRRTRSEVHRAAHSCARRPIGSDEAPPARTVYLRRYSPPPTAHRFTHCFAVNEVTGAGACDRIQRENDFHCRWRKWPKGMHLALSITSLIYCWKHQLFIKVTKEAKIQCNVIYFITIGLLKLNAQNIKRLHRFRRVPMFLCANNFF